MDIDGKEDNKPASGPSEPEGGFLSRNILRLKEMVNRRSQSPNENSRLLDRASPSNEPQTRESSGSSSTVNNSGEVYEELFKDSVPCPSCRGLGRVPKELENQLVALIPLKDDRLKPRRTILFVGIAVSLCAITAGLLIFFLMPRDIILSSNRPLLQPTYIFVNATPPNYFANFTVVNHYNVSNNNFYPVKISGVKMKSLYSDAVIATTEAYKNEPLSIPARSEGELSIPIDFILQDDHKDLAQHCTSHWTWIHNLPILFEVTANYTYMGHSEQAALTTFQMVSCFPPPKPTTTPAPTTTTLPTTTTTTITTTLPPTTPATTIKTTTSAKTTKQSSTAESLVKKMEITPEVESS